MFDNSVKVIVATNASGLDITKLNVGFIIHSCFPLSMGSYYPESGVGERLTDRVVFFSEQDKSNYEHFIQHSKFWDSYKKNLALKKLYKIIRSYKKISCSKSRLDYVLNDLVKEI